jgi:hypothetical protein
MCHMMEIMRAVRRVMRKDATCFLNIGDSYGSRPDGSHGGWNGDFGERTGKLSRYTNAGTGVRPHLGLKPKDLMLIPWRLVIRLQDDGWFVRSAICWAKKAPMPESVTDRPTSAWEPVFLLTRSSKYFYDAEAVKEEAEYGENRATFAGGNARIREANICTGGATPSDRGVPRPAVTKRNQRNFWLLGPEPFAEAHFATFPSEIPRRCIKAGTSEKGVCPECGAPWMRQLDSRFERQQGSRRVKGLDQSNGWSGFPRGITLTQTLGWQPSCRCNAGTPTPATILDPFAGAGTTLLVADQLQRNAIGIDLNPNYTQMTTTRLQDDNSLFLQLDAAK